MRSDRTGEPLLIALAVDDAALADRLASLLGDAPGLRLVNSGDAADVLVVMPSRIEAESDAETLTPREREVLALLAEGASNKLIARRLGISVHTAKFHVGSVIDKLDAMGRTDAVTHAVRLGIIQL